MPSVSTCDSRSPCVSFWQESHLHVCGTPLPISKLTSFQAYSPGLVAGMWLLKLAVTGTHGKFKWVGQKMEAVSDITPIKSRG